MGDKLLTLEEWAERVYGDRPPSNTTLRRWIKNSMIYPQPEKHGKFYRVLESARYSDPTKPARQPAPQQAARPAPRGSLVERLRQESGRGKTA